MGSTVLMTHFFSTLITIIANIDITITINSLIKKLSPFPKMTHMHFSPKDFKKKKVLEQKNVLCVCETNYVKMYNIIRKKKYIDDDCNLMKA